MAFTVCSEPFKIPAYELSEEGSGFSIITLTLLIELDLLWGEGDDEEESLECCDSAAMVGGDLSVAENPEEGLVVGVEGNMPDREILSILSERLSSAMRIIYFSKISLTNKENSYLLLLLEYNVNHGHVLVYRGHLFHY